MGKIPNKPGRLEKIIELAKTVLEAEITVNSSMSNTPGWSSIKTLQLIMALDECGISLPLEKIADIRSIRDIADAAGMASAASTANISETENA